MRLWIGWLLALAAVAASAAEDRPDLLLPPHPQGQLTAPPTEPGWLNLLDEIHAEGWKPSVRLVKMFEIKDSALHILGVQKGGYVCYVPERLRDFQLHIEFKVLAQTNSGIVLRGEVEDPALTGVEIQVLDDFGRDPNRYSCGAMYDVATPMFNMSFPAGQWNSFDIAYRGRLLAVAMNGWKILDVDLAKMAMPIGKFPTPFAQLATDGLLFLQDYGGEVWYRNIFLKKLDNKEK